MANDTYYLDDLAQQIRAVNQANGWNPVVPDDWHRDKHRIPSMLALLHSEVSEALEEYRRDSMSKFLTELADVQIRLLDLAGGLTNDFERIVLEKLEKNRGRGYRHGGKRV